MLVRTPLLRRAALWPQALAACQQELHNLSSAKDPSAPSHTLSDSAAAWATFFHKLQLQRPSESAHSCCDLLPSPLLRAIGQHWVDVALAQVMAQYVAEVCSRTSSPHSQSVTMNSPDGVAGTAAASTAVSAPAPVLDSVLSLWGAHTLLAALWRDSTREPSTSLVEQSSASSPLRTVQSVLSQSFQEELLPVVVYLTCYSIPSRGSARLAAAQVLRRSLVVVLTSLLSEWHVTDSSMTSKRTEAVVMYPAERALAQELCSCIGILNAAISAETQRVAAGGDSARDSAAANRSSTCHDGAASLWHQTTLQFEQLQRALEEGQVSDDETTSVGPLQHACATFMESFVSRSAKSEAATGEMARPLPPLPALCPSPFVGITGVSPTPDEPEDVVMRINAALNQVARESTGRP